MHLTQEQSTHQAQFTTLDYDLKAEQALRFEIYGHPSMCYRDPQLIKQIGDGCYRTKPANEAWHN